MNEDQPGTVEAQLQHLQERVGALESALRLSGIALTGTDRQALLRR